MEPDAREFKYYAPGVGLILVEEGLNDAFRHPEATLELVRVVPEPGTLTLLGLGLAAMCALGARKAHSRQAGAMAQPRAQALPPGETAADHAQALILPEASCRRLP